MTAWGNPSGHTKMSTSNQRPVEYYDFSGSDEGFVDEKKSFSGC